MCLTNVAHRSCFPSLHTAPSMIPVDLEISALGSKSLKLSWSWPKHLKADHPSRTPMNKQIVKGYNIAYRLVPDQAAPGLENGSAFKNSSGSGGHQLSPSATLVNKRNGRQSTNSPANADQSESRNQNFIVKSIESSDQDKERFVLLGLRKHSKYEVKVQAYNSGKFLFELLILKKEK